MLRRRGAGVDASADAHGTLFGSLWPVKAARGRWLYSWGVGGDRRGTVLVALGGNALVAEDQSGTYSEQCANAERVAEMLGELHTQRGLIVTHGNGPQVGALALQQLAAREEVPPMPLDALGAMTEGMIGYVLMSALTERVDATVVALVTRVEVDRNDPAFAEPEKPIGPFYSKGEAERLAAEYDWQVVEDSERGWRRVVPSPEPLRVVEADAVGALLERDVVVVAGGGGGIPVVATDDGRLEGVSAVIDKDRSAAVLASAVGAELLVLLTGVPRIALDFGTSEEREVECLSAKEARHHLDDGQFPPGSMGPKVEAALRFVENGGDAAIVSDFDHAGAAVVGGHGTRIVP
jgi:carbamate kinase